MAISKAALCCGFAIALRALFLGILYKCLSVIARGASLAAINEQRIPVRLIASLTLAMTKMAYAKFSIVMLSEAKHCIIASESVSSVTIETNQRSAPSGAQKPRI